MALTPTIDQSFVEQFEREVHLVYQRMTAMLPNTARRKNNVKGTQTTFQKIGSGVAGTKTRHGAVPILNLAHTPVACVLEDAYAGEYVDSLDELKIEHDERLAVAQSIAAAMGRKSDQIFIDAAEATTNESGATGGSGGLALDRAGVTLITKFFGGNEVPNDGNRFGVVPTAGWDDLMALTEFASADYVTDRPYVGIGSMVKNWYRLNWMEHTGLTSDDSGERNALCYHKSAIGFASAKEYSLDVTWQGKEQAFLFVGCLSQGAVIIDEDGTYRYRVEE